LYIGFQFLSSGMGVSCNFFHWILSLKVLKYTGNCKNFHRVLSPIGGISGVSIVNFAFTILSALFFIDVHTKSIDES
jgi:hypothetical protein